MARPVVILTDFASAEDVAQAFGISTSRVRTIQRLLTRSKNHVAHQNDKKSRQPKLQNTSPKRGKRRGAANSK